MLFEIRYDEKKDDFNIFKCNKEELDLGFLKIFDMKDIVLVLEKFLYYDSEFDEDMQEMNEAYNIIGNRVYKTKEKKELIRKNMTKAEIAEAYSVYFSLRIEEIINLKNELEDFVLYLIYDTLTDTEEDFWHTEEGDYETYIKEEKINVDDLYSYVYENDTMFEMTDKICKKHREYYIQKGINTNCMRNFFNEYLPMFDVDKLLKTIKLNIINFEGTNVSIEFSSSIWEGELFHHTVMYIFYDNTIRINF